MLAGRGRAAPGRSQDTWNLLVTLVDQLDLTERVRFLGSRDDARDVIAASDVYCQPNLEPEAFGLSLIEAMYARLPVVTSAAGGALEIVDDTCGELTPLGDAGAVADALARLIADPARRDSLGDAGRHRARALCAPDLQMPHIERVLASAARTRPAAMDGRMPARPFARLRIAMLSYRLPVRRREARRHRTGRAHAGAGPGRAGPSRRGVLARSRVRTAPTTRSGELPWKGFVNTWLGRRLTMGYLGNVLALVPSYREFDAVIAHGDSLLLGLCGKPVLRVMHGSALGEARSAQSWGRWRAAMGRLRAGAGHRGAAARRGGREREHQARQPLRLEGHSSRRRSARVPRRGRIEDRAAVGAVRGHARRPQARALSDRRLRKHHPRRPSDRHADRGRPGGPDACRA